MIYIIQAGIDGPFKVGYTRDEASLRRRMQQIQTCSPERLDIRFFGEGSRIQEKAAHRVLRHHTLIGEWFKPTHKVLRFVESAVEAGISSAIRIQPSLTGSSSSMFTDRYLKSLKSTGANRRIYESGSDRGFCLQVTKAGSIIFEQQYSLKGSRHFHRLGRYPEMPISAARLKAREVRSLVDQGIDPRYRQVDTGTVAQLMDAYLAHLEGKGRKTTTNIRRSIEANFLAKFGDRPAKDIQPRDIRETLYQLIRRGAPTHANRLRSHLHAMYQYGVHHDNDPKSLSSAMTFQIEHNPVANVPRDQSAERVGQRVLSWEEIRQVWHAPELSLPSLFAIRLILATGGQRVRMITAASWDEINPRERIWLVAGSRMKARQDHLIPLTELILSQFRELGRIYPGSRWLFPARHAPGATKPQDICTLPHVIQDYCKLVGMEPWVPKDLRRTAKTRMGEIGIAKDIRDRIQGHAMQDVSSRHYDRYSYVSEKREALERWEKHLTGVLG